MQKTIVSSLVYALISLSTVNAVPLFDGEVEVGVTQQKPEGWLSYKGDVVDLREDLGFDDKFKPFVKAKLEHPIPILPNIYIEYIPMDFEGDRITTFRFDDITYVGNVHTEVKIDHYDLGLYYNIPMVSMMTSGVFDAEAGIIIRLIDFEAKVTDGVRSSTADFVAPIPLLYGSITINPIDFVSVVGEGKGVKYNESYYYEFSGEVRISPFSAIVMKPFIALGYRIERLKIEDVENVYSDIRIKQPYLSFGINF